MGLVRAACCARCGRDVRGLPEAREEGRLSFCSQSCYLQHVSAATHAGGRAGAEVGTRPARGAAVGGLRVIGKTIKWVILVVLATTAFVIAVGVAVGHAVNDANRSFDKADAHSRRAASAYRTIKHGATMTLVRRRLGGPDDAQAHRFLGVREECWYYGSVFSGREYEFCFRRGKLSSKARL